MVGARLAALAALAGLLALAGTPAAAQDPATPAVGPGEVVLEVQASGMTQVTPDLASLVVGMVSTGASVSEATTANAAMMAKVIAAIRNAGIDPRFIRTQQISLQPRFGRSSPNDFDGTAQISGYIARNSVIVTITRPDLAPTIIGAAYEAGANSVSGPNFSLQDDRAALSAARIDALRRARAAAEDYAKGLGMRVLRVVKVSDRGSFANSGEIVVTASRAVENAPLPPLSRGELTQRVTVWVAYALAP